MNNDNKNPFEDMTHYELLQAIYNGTVNPKNLPKEIRQALVQILILRGQEKVTIAKILKVTDRTIRRDVEDIWKQNALVRDPEFTRRFVGEVHTRAMSFVEMLTRMAHSADASMNERSLAALRAWQPLKGLFEKLQSLGYLPLENHRVVPPDETKVSEPKMPKGCKINKADKREARILKKINSMHPMERERLRVSLQKEIMAIAKEAAEKEKLASDADQQKKLIEKNDDEPDAAGAVAAT